MSNASTSTSPSIEALMSTLARERAARKQAEQFLEQKSRELYDSHLELQQFTKALEKEAKRSKAVFDTAAEGIIIFREDGTVESINKAASNIFQIAPEHDTQVNICDLFPDAAFCRIPEQGCLVQNLKDLTGDANEISGRRSDGSSVALEFVVSSFEQDESICHSAIVRDLTRRKLLESQLAQAQKLESVGQLAAGIAHELNTPIQFVGDNTRFLRDSFLALEEVLKLIDALIPKHGESIEIDEFSDSIHQLDERFDLEFLRTEIPMAIDQTLQGAENVARIVRAMKVFSHPGSQDYQEVDLNQSLESTLTVSRNEWKYCAQAVTHFAKNLPRVCCFPGELNQAFLNLIVNGAHAIQAKKPEGLGQIAITTSSDGENVTIDIQDSGTGIPESIRSRIFDPFFTTKGVGKGTGQGLSICYNIIVELHHGKLSFDTVEGVGTTFHVTLPIDPRKSQSKRETSS